MLKFYLTVPDASFYKDCISERNAECLQLLRTHNVGYQLCFCERGANLESTNLVGDECGVFVQVLILCSSMQAACLCWYSVYF